MIKRCTTRDHDGWLPLRIALWPDRAADADYDKKNLFSAPERYLVLTFADESGNAVGLAEASIRRDYVNGTRTWPIGVYDVPRWMVFADKFAPTGKLGAGQPTVCLVGDLMKEQARLMPARAQVVLRKGRGVGTWINARFKSQGVGLELPRRDEKVRVVDFGERVVEVLTPSRLKPVPQVFCGVSAPPCRAIRRQAGSHRFRVGRVFWLRQGQSGEHGWRGEALFDG